MKKYLMIAATVLAVASVQATIVKEFSFETGGDLEGWTQAANGHFQSLAQATASTGEGVAQVQLNAAPGGYDGQMLYSATSLTPSGGETWDTIEFRMRQLVNNAGAPGGAQTIDFSGTAMTIDVGGIKSVGLFNTSYYTQVTGSGGWSVFTVDLAQFLSDKGLADNATIAAIRIDPIGAPVSASKWAQVDYIKVTSIPEPATLGLIGAFGGGIFFIRRRFMI